MKYGILITAYKDFNLLISLIEKYSEYANVYVHIDKRSSVGDETIEYLNSLKKTKIIRNHKVYWGSYKHILAILDLMRLAYDDGCEYYSILSENTIPVASMQEIYDFFSSNDKIFMEVKTRSKFSRTFEFEDRYNAYFFQDLYNHKSSNCLLRGIAKTLEKFSTDIQRLLKVRNNVVFNYKGYVYCHLNREAVEEIFEKISTDTNYINEIKRCYVGEEFFFQNILMHSPLSEKIINDNLVYDDWDKGCPAFLQLDDIPAIEKSGKLFARKVLSDSPLIKTYI